MVKKIKILLVTAFSACYFFSVNAQQVELKTEIDSLSYIIGMNIGTNIQQQMQQFPGEKIQLDILLNGLSGAIKGENLLIQNNEEAMSFLQKYFSKIEAQESAIRNEKAQENKQKGEIFLEENKKRATVFTTPSGLQYEVITEGKGKKPTVDNEVKVHYRGTFIDGTEFDSSYSRNEPAVFGLTQVISGWTEALQLMKEGSTWKIYLPYNLGYGEQAMGNIQPYSTLVFEVELIEIVKTDKPEEKTDKKTDKKK